jgi:ABC-type uncharacterized transport system ATPase subunit
MSGSGVDPTADSAGSIHLEVRDLRVHYDGIQAVHGVSFNVRRGEIVTLIGANGAGKTSILRAISGLIPTTAVSASPAVTFAACPPTASWDWAWRTFRKDEAFLAT